MPTLLHLDSSADLAGSRTRLLTAAFAEAWAARGDDHVVVVRDLHADPLPALRSTAQHWPQRLRSEALDPRVEALQDGVIGELLAADAVVIGAPTYNFAMPATLKAWLDLVHVPGITAPFDADARPLAGVPAVVCTARGGAADDLPDLVAGPLHRVLGDSMGMAVQTVAVSGTLADVVPELDAEAARAELDEARARVRELGATLARA